MRMIRSDRGAAFLQRGSDQVGDPSYIDEVHQDICEFVGRHADFFDDDDKTNEFIEALLEKKGYKRESHWAPPEKAPRSKGGGSSYFRK